MRNFLGAKTSEHSALSVFTAMIVLEKSIMNLNCLTKQCLDYLHLYY